MIVALVRAKVLALLLGPAGYGVISTVDQTVVSLVQLGAFSMPFTALKFMAREYGHPEAFAKEFATFFAAIGACGLLTVLLSAGVLTWYPGVFGSDLIVLRPYLLLALLGVPAAMLHILFVHTLAAAQRGTSSAWLNMLVLMALAVASVIGVVVAGIRGVYLFTVGAGVLSAIVGLRYIMGQLRLTMHASPSVLLTAFRKNPEIVKYSFLVYSALAAYSLTMLATRYFVFAGLGAAQAGLLQALIGIGLTVGAMLNSMNTLYFVPVINSRLPVPEKEKAANLFARRILLLLIVGGLGVSLFPGTLLKLLFSHEFLPGAGVLFAFVIWQLIYQMANVYLQLLIGLDEVAAYAIATCVGYGIASVLFPSFISRFGLAGAAMALSCALVISAVVALGRLRWRFNVSVDGGVVARFCFGLLVILGARFAFRHTAELTVSGVALRGAFALAVALVLWLTLASDERRFLLSRLPQSARLRFAVSRSRSEDDDPTA
ncbi:MAG: hypothetical protein ABIP93_13885 [Gemmatimonadaceae bacterium]